MINTKFVENLLDFSNIQKRGSGQRSHEYWVRPRKSGKF
eukprot:UN12547